MRLSLFRRRPAAPPDLEHEVAEGLLLAEHAVRLAVKNRILVDVLGHGSSFDQQHAALQIRAELGALVQEHQEAARRMRADARLAVLRPGRGAHQHDYRAIDRRNLRRRADVAEELSRRLGAAQVDDDAVTALVDAARADAWEDVAREVHGALRRAESDAPPPVPELDPEERILRQQMVVAIDLTALAEERGVALDA